MRTSCLILVLIFSWCTMPGQTSYAEPVFQVREEQDILFGSAPDFQGVETSLFLDLYKPVGDGNCLRPVMLIAHGGSWYAGSRKDPEVVAICREMAARGYLAASLEYRLGHYKTESYTPFAACPLDECIYVADTSEIYRAIYRGVQDAWKALDFLAERSNADSTDISNMFMAGVSAGGFVALQTLLWEDPGMRPAQSLQLAPVRDPDPDLSDCFPDTRQRNRPDMGPARSPRPPNAPAPIVQGVANFFGGIMTPGDLVALEGRPLFLYHQTNDLIVHCGRAPLLRPLYQHCLIPLNLCQPAIRMPVAYGSCAMEDLISTNSWNIPVVSSIDDNGPPNGLACLANPSTHSITNLPLRCQQMADHFSPFITASGNDPDSNCLRLTGIDGPGRSSMFRPKFFPNPTNGQLHFSGLTGVAWNLEVYSVQGRIFGKWGPLPTSRDGMLSLPISGLPAGIYLVRLFNGSSSYTYRVLVLEE